MALATNTNLFENDRTQSLGVIEQAVICAATDPTTTYAALGDHVKCDRASRVTLLFVAAWVSASHQNYYVEWSHDATTWFRTPNVATAAGVNTLTENENKIALGAALNWSDHFPVVAPYMRIFAKRTVGAAGDTLAVRALLFWF